MSNMSLLIIKNKNCLNKIVINYLKNIFSCVDEPFYMKLRIILKHIM